MINFDDWQKVELVTARVLEAVEHADADRLLVLKLEIGEEEPRQVVAGIRGHYELESLVGKLVVALVNLERVKTEYGKAQESYQQLIVLNEESRAVMRSALEAMRQLAKTRLLDYQEDRVFAGISANPSREIRIRAECGLDLAALLEEIRENRG